MPLRRVPFERIENFRDLGGYASSYGETSFGVLFRSGYLKDATPQDIERLALLPVKTIIDLREPGELVKEPDKTLGDSRFHHISIPTNGRLPQGRYDMIDSYVENLLDLKTARAVFRTLLTSQKPALIHCTAGKDRTGVFLAILLLANGVPFHDVNADYMLSFPYLTRMTRETRKNLPDLKKALLTPDQFFLKKVLQKFNKAFPSIIEYFGALDFNDDEIRCLENLLGKQELSSGAVLFSNGKVLVEHMAKGHYSLPKGHVEKVDADEVATAKREIKEELGLDADIDDRKKTSIVYSPSDGVCKRVDFFLGTADETKPMVFQKDEVQDAYWLEPKDALRVLSHDSDRDVLRWAYRQRALNK